MSGPHLAASSKRLAVLSGLSVGPCFAYLVWAAVNHRWGHLAAAATLNLLLWTAGPLWLAHTARILP